MDQIYGFLNSVPALSWTPVDKIGTGQNTVPGCQSKGVFYPVGPDILV